jgi:hypothetical protein
MCTVKDCMKFRWGLPREPGLILTSNMTIIQWQYTFQKCILLLNVM